MIVTIIIDHNGDFVSGHKASATKQPNNKILSDFVISLLPLDRERKAIANVLKPASTATIAPAPAPSKMSPAATVNDTMLHMSQVYK